MQDANGVGLAANQVGVLQRVLVLQPNEDGSVALVNPVLRESSDEVETDDEGCLSLQGVTVPVERKCRVTVEGLDEHGRARSASSSRGSAPAWCSTSSTTSTACSSSSAPPTTTRGARRSPSCGPGSRSRPRSGRIGVAATADFGADVLERLAERHEVAFLLTRPDRPAGRGRKTTAPPAKLVAERLGIPVLQPERPAEAELDADTIVLVAYGALIPPELLERHEWLNVHPSLLPRWRGAAPVERAIMAGDDETGVSVIRLVEELDAGPIGAQEAFPIEPDDDAGSVFARAAELAPGLIDAATSFSPAGGRGDLRRQDRPRRP